MNALPAAMLKGIVRSHVAVSDRPLEEHTHLPPGTIRLFHREKGKRQIQKKSQKHTIIYNDSAVWFDRVRLTHF